MVLEAGEHAACTNIVFKGILVRDCLSYIYTWLESNCAKHLGGYIFKYQWSCTHTQNICTCVRC